MDYLLTLLQFCVFGISFGWIVLNVILAQMHISLVNLTMQNPYYVIILAEIYNIVYHGFAKQNSIAKCKVYGSFTHE